MPIGKFTNNLRVLGTVLLQPRFVLASDTHATTEGHVAIYDLCCYLKHVGAQGSTTASAILILVAWGHGDVLIVMPQRAMSGSRFLLRQWAILMSMVCTLETMLMSIVCADAWDYVDVCGPFYLQTPCVSPWPMLLLTVKCKDAPFAMELMTADSQLRKKKRHRSILFQPLPRPHCTPTTLKK